MYFVFLTKLSLILIKNIQYFIQKYTSDSFQIIYPDIIFFYISIGTSICFKLTYYIFF